MPQKMLQPTFTSKSASPQLHTQQRFSGLVLPRKYSKKVGFASEDNVAGARRLTGIKVTGGTFKRHGHDISPPQIASNF